MLDASAGYETLFADHYVDLRAPHAGAVMAARLRKNGLVTLDGLAIRQEVLEFASRLMTITPHIDGGSTTGTRTRQKSTPLRKKTRTRPAAPSGVCWPGPGSRATSVADGLHESQFGASGAAR
ncbi:hypothetical protein [Streptomyces sp. NPDC059256]|uniref:hypothetical protein n=1 Tax=Streptomyces sp. NPDC059256 TaxID=3346794 RepID=UPI0036C4E442